MPLYRLEPTIESVGYEDWSASTDKTLDYVEDGPEKEAHDITLQTFWTKAEKSLGRHSTAQPIDKSGQGALSI